ncbi:GntP family permease [Thalassococcus sp. S3]|uniref:GntP family permease n=1 Tax=Thalassococcus sp. S3 TaxID=2017482 RepID=UPI0010244BC9|nr:GntP family permease [Thalassococcus sp. S3]QBF29875.1 transporter [Thalassococcus sp. S3]
MLAALTVILPLGLLIWAAYRGWPVMVVAPLMALLGAALATDPLMATLTQRFMPATGGFVISFLPLFLLGAIFGRMMEVSGAAHAIATAIVDRLGPSQAIPAVVLACAALTYGGVSLFVVAFAIFPLAAVLFRQSDLPYHLIPAAIALGAFTFTMTALPGTPAIQNAIPMPYFGTTVFAAPGLGLVAALIMAGGGLLYLQLASRRGHPAGAFPHPQAESDTRSDLPPFWAAITPVLSVFVLNYTLSEVFLPAQDLSYLAQPDWGETSGEAVTGLWSLILSLTGAIVILMLLMRSRIATPKEDLGKGASASLLPLFNTAALVGFGAVIAGLPAFAAISGWIEDLPGGVVVGLAVSTSVLAGITGSASGGMSIALDALGAEYLAQANAAGISPDVLHRVTALATGGLDALPHNGAVVTLLAIAGLSHREAYGPIFVVAVAIPVLALLAVLVLSTQFGSF